MPTNGFPVVFERGTVEIEVFFLSNFLWITAGARMRGIRKLNDLTYRAQIGGWEFA